ncbi:MAG: hypothetical protein WC455_14595 [Dehalococcoidia bacterium]|jgi:hypothetical protein
MRAAILILLLAAGALLAGDITIILKIERNAPVDSILSEARMIEPRLGEIQVSNGLFELRGYRTDSLGDTLRLIPLLRPGVSLLWSADSAR